MSVTESVRNLSILQRRRGSKLGSFATDMVRLFCARLFKMSRTESCALATFRRVTSRRSGARPFVTNRTLVQCIRSGLDRAKIDRSHGDVLALVDLGLAPSFFHNARRAAQCFWLKRAAAWTLSFVRSRASSATHSLVACVRIHAYVC